jgi:hypothetical protein
MSPANEQRLKDLKDEIHDAARDLQDGDSTACCNRLVDAFFLLTEYLEEEG